MKKYITFAFMFLFTAGLALAQTTTQVVQQRSSGNVLNLKQAAQSGNRAYVYQNYYSRATVEQTGAENYARSAGYRSAITQTQRGDRNTADVSSYYYTSSRYAQSSTITQTQEGNGNTARVRNTNYRGGDASRYSTIKQTQKGDGNLAEINSRGTSGPDRASVEQHQEGHRNASRLSDLDYGARVQTAQFGEDNSISAGFGGYDYNAVTIHQGDEADFTKAAGKNATTGSKNAFSATLYSKSNTLTGKQLGSSNRARVYDTYGGSSTFDVTQTGNLSYADLYLNRAGNSSISISQTAANKLDPRGKGADYAGFNNVVDLDMFVGGRVSITQNGDLNTAQLTLRANGHATLNQQGNNNSIVIEQ